MPAVLSVNPLIVETALRQLEQIHAQMTGDLLVGSTALNMAEVGDWYNTTFRSAKTAYESADQARRDLQQALTDVLLADSGLDVSALVSVLGAPIGDVTVDQLLAAIPKAALNEVQKIINKADDLAMTQHELDLVYDKLSGLSDKDRAFVLTSLTDEENTRLFHNVHDSGVCSDDWSDPKRADFYDLYQCLPISDKSRLGLFSPYLGMLAEAEGATADNQAAKDALEALRTDDGFNLVSFDQRIALLAQAGNYPNEKSISRLGQLADQDWFQDSSLEDSQRSAKSIAYLAAHTRGDQKVISNTLDWLLDPESNSQLGWKPLMVKDGTKYGEAGNDKLTLNSSLLEAGNGPVVESSGGDSESHAKHLLLHSIAHEVNHVVNGDSPEPTERGVMGEYRAWYVGFLAENGHPPTRYEAADRFYTELTLYEDPVAAIRKEADLDSDQETPILDFMRPLWNPDLNISSDGLVGALELSLQPESGFQIVNPEDPGPEPVAVDGGPNNLTNG